MPTPFKKGTTLALCIIQSVLLALTAVTLFFSVLFAISYLTVPDIPEGSEIGTQISVGLSRGLSAAFFVIAAIATAILSVPGEAIAISLTAKNTGRSRVYGICAIVIYAVFILACGVFWIFVV